MAGKGSLAVVGTGFMVAGQVTPESLSELETADRVFYLLAEPATRHWIEAVRPDAESLLNCFWEGRPRQQAYEEVVERLLAPVRQGLHVCAALYGHPGVFVYASHEAIQRARNEGLEARMLPGISAEDCLFADLEIDPAARGCQSFEATDFLVRARAFDPRSGLVLWQIGALGVTTYHLRDLWNEGGVSLVVEKLARSYPLDHDVVVYEASYYPICEPRIQRTRVRDLAAARLSTESTLWVPPLERAPLDEAMLARCGLGAAGSAPRPLAERGATLASPAPLASPPPSDVTLTVVGTGYMVAGQVTPEARSSMEGADRLFYLVSDPATSAWLRALHPRAESLHDCYRVGEPGIVGAGRMVERILAALRAGESTCAAFYGHPAICVPPGLESVRHARAEGFVARLLPAISFEDCLFADLGVDPGVSGRLMYEATDFLVRPRVVDPTAALVLLQAGAVGLTEFAPGDTPNRDGLRLLGEALQRHYPAGHDVALYRMPQLPMFPPEIHWTPLARLHDAPLSVVSTLFVPPLPRREVDAELLRRLQETAASPGEATSAPNWRPA